ncbi:hypothetical protein ACWGIU_32490 [Streptomyces sp. NPDC054840]
MPTIRSLDESTGLTARRTGSYVRCPVGPDADLASPAGRDGLAGFRCPGGRRLRVWAAAPAAVRPRPPFVREGPPRASAAGQRGRRGLGPIGRHRPGCPAKPAPPG